MTSRAVASILRFTGCVPVVLAVLAGAACDEAPTQPSNLATVSGTVSYRERIALADNTLVEVTLADVSRQDVAAIIVAQSSFVAGGRQVPLPFALSYDPARIEQNRSYALRATIRGEGQLLFTTDTVVRVLTQGYPASANLLLIRVARQP